MRNRIVALIGEAASGDPNVLFMTGDLGFSVVENLQAQLGERFINAGIAESNMMTMAGSLGLCGFQPYVYSITPFVTARCLEQIRNDVCYHDVPARIVGIAGGFSYGTLGPTHHALEDATIMAALPNMTVFSPATVSELECLFRLSGQISGPIYYRLARESGPAAPPVDFDLADPVVVWRDGADVNLVMSGCIAGAAFAAVELLAAQGVSARLISVPVIEPFPADSVRRRLATAPTVAVFEGYPDNPLEVGMLRLFAAGAPGPLRCLSVPKSFAKVVGSTEFQRASAGIDAAAIANSVHQLLGGSGR